jgi:hypothetical protein
MATTKTKKASSPKSSKPKAAAKPRRSSPKRKAAAKPSASKPGAAKSSTASKSGASAGKSSSNGHSPGRKAVIPLVAGGAALAGTVGGVLIGAKRSGGKVLGVHLPRPKRVQFKLDSGDLAKAAKQVGHFGENVGELTTELKRARQGLAGDNKHSSPIEVLLRGLTTRR